MSSHHRARPARRILQHLLTPPAAVAPFAVALAYGGGLWLHVLHEAAGATELNEPPPVIHWLRDSTLALPLILVAVWAALLLARAYLARYARGASRLLSAAVVAAIVALIASAVVAAATPLHGLLFPAQHLDHDGRALPLVAHIADDGLLALVANLPLALAVAALRSIGQWATRPSAPRPVQVRWQLALAGLLTLVIMLPSGARLPQTTFAAAPDPGQPCPSSGAPLKSFDVQAIDVDITLNRFGDHDPLGKMYVLTAINGLPTPGVAAVRAEEASHQVSSGLSDDPIQPLVIRANEGDCVQMTFTNNASGGAYGLHIDGLAFQVGSSGDALGQNPASSVPQGGSITYRYYVPNDPTLEGAHYLHPGPGNRDAVSHGLFGALVVEPPGSTYLDLNPKNTAPLASGWEASIVPGPVNGVQPRAFREYVQLYHEIGNESFDILDKNNHALPRVDPFTGAYRPGSKAINYRSEPFFNRSGKAPEQDSQGYGSYTFGDPATPIQRSYLGDPTKIRILHAGSEVFHVFHLHGGGIRWRFNPHADPTYNYADTGLQKHPATIASPSTRLDSQAIGPGESYDMEIEGGAGGVQQGVGEFLFHCHIAHHYVSGMWGFWRVYNTLQPDLAPLPDSTPPPQAVDSSGLLGKTYNGVTLTKDNLDAWIRPQLPPQGLRRSDQDASVWNWTIDKSTPGAPVYLGEPDDTGSWPNFPNVVPGHPPAYLGDQYAQTAGLTDRPKILFDPDNGRIAWPLLRTHVGQRPPFSPNGHSGAPYLGETGGQAPDPSKTVDPWANRADGICPQGAPLRRYNVVAIELPIQVTRKGATDPAGKIYVLAHNKADVLAGRKPAEPLAIRANVGDCVAVTLTSELTDANAFGNFSKVNMHIHHVQFDTQASDGVITGLSYEQSVRPYKAEDPQLAAPAAAGATTLRLSSVAKFLNPNGRQQNPDGSLRQEWIGIGLGTEGIEVRQIKTVDATANTVTLTQPLSAAHAAGEWAGTEFVQYRWYPDVELDNVFWHDHVDGIHTWGHGLVGQLIVEPAGSTYTNPDGSPSDGSGTILDIHTTTALAPGLVTGSFRELALWMIDEMPLTDSSFNLRAEPWSDRSNDPSLRFSSYTNGDPFTPLPRAYPGDPFVIHTINVSGGVDTLHVDGHRVLYENRYLDPNGKPEASPQDTIHEGVSERFTLMLVGGAGGPQHRAGDYLYMNGIGRRFRQGAWGLIRVLPGKAADLEALESNPNPPLDGTFQAPAVTGGRPPATTTPGNPCPSGAPPHRFAVSAVDVPSSGSFQGAVRTAFVPTADAAAVLNGTKAPEPLVLHVAAGECITVHFTNQSGNQFASFHVGKLLRDPASSGINVGFTPEQTVARGQSRDYVLYADSDQLGSAVISDFGGDDTGKTGLYGAVVVAPAGATFSDPVTGAAKDVGSQVDVHVPHAPGYRDFTLAFSDNDPEIGQSHMPYPTVVQRPALVNYQSAPRSDDTGSAFSSQGSGDPPTPLLRAYAGDAVEVHALVAPGSEQMHVFTLGGFSWELDPMLINDSPVQSRGIGAWETIDAGIIGGAGGPAHAAGDFFYGDLRRPFTQAGMWGLLRVLPTSGSGCPIKPLDGLTCAG